MSTRRQMAEPSHEDVKTSRPADRQQTTSRGKKSKRGNRPKLPALEKWTEREWEPFVKRLETRRSPAPLSALVPAHSKHPLKWAAPDGYAQLPADNVLKQLIRLAKHPRRTVSDMPPQADSWIQQARQREPDSLFGLECLAWCHLLPRLAAEMDRELWLQLVGQLREIAKSSAGLCLEDDPVTHQLLNGELPWTLGYLFPKIDEWQLSAQLATHALSRGAVELLDGEGLPAGVHLPRIRSLLACWTRCHLMAKRGRAACMDEDGRQQYVWMVQQTLRMTRPDGSQYFSTGRSGQRCPDLIAAALACGGKAMNRRLAARVLPGPKTTEKRISSGKLPPPQLYSEWSEVCIMRDSWNRKSSYLAFRFDERMFRLEFSLAGQMMVAGNWEPQVRLDGRELPAQSDWRELCWYTDDEVDYLELEMDLDEHWQIQRQILFGRSESLVYLADVVVGPTSAESTNINYQASLPLAPNIAFQREPKTRDGLLGCGKTWTAVLPISLAEWQSSPTGGSVEADQNQLTLKQSAVGRALYAPLLFDCSQRRIRKARTWRSLTVAERLVTQPADVAVGYRVQSGRDQWLIYRSLAAKANRTLLGQNTSDEFVFARFTTDGEAKSIVEVE